MDLTHQEHLGVLTCRFIYSLCIHGIIVRKDRGQIEKTLLVVPEEDLDGKPGVTADLEALRQRVDLLHLLVGQLPAVELEVAHDTGGCDGLGDDAGAALKSPHEQHLLDGLALVVGELLELVVLVEGRVGGTKAGVGSAVNALLLAVVEKLGSAVMLAFVLLFTLPAQLTKGCWGGARLGSQRG
jgi:hypothetical protein